MLSASDIVTLPYDTQFSRAGVQYARHSLNFTYNRMRLNAGDRLRKIVAGIAFEMATRRWLEGMSIRYNRLGATAFTDADRFDLAVGGRRCDLKSSLIYDKRKIMDLHADAGWVLDALALVPEDQFESERMTEHDIYVFGFVTGLEARHSDDTEKALARQLPVYLMHPLPREAWGGGAQWGSLGGVAIKSNASKPIAVEVGGQNRGRESVRERIKLSPRVRSELKTDFYSLLYLRVPCLPDAQIAVHSATLDEMYMVDPSDWANIWVYGQRVYVCGWMNKHDFRACSQHLPAQSPAKQYRHTATNNRALPISDLRPMGELAELAQRHIGL